MVVIEKGTVVLGRDDELQAFIPDTKKYVMFIDIEKGKFFEVSPELLEHVYNGLAEVT